ncbi:MAG: Citryl-CoA lyase [Enterovirga sp.]|jgi:citrate lyase subunit beta/citryl-CoA lyase|nr:Citryl-CoA lyase [Enterovirga sp.]
MRSFLFVPGDSARKFERGSAGDADALILDLEDSVSPDRKEAARALTAGMLGGARPAPRLWVRVNALDTGLTLADLAAVMPAGPDGIVLPKCASAADVATLSNWLDAFEAASGRSGAGTRIMAIATETAGSIFGLGSYRDAGPRLWGLMWGAEDLSASLGATENRRDGAFHSPFRLARDLCLMGAAAAGIVAVDTVFTDIDNLADLEAESVAARRDGFGAKAVIHPKHVAVVNRAFTPDEAEVAWAHRIVEAFAGAAEVGVIRIDGKMIDKPHLRAAERILAGLPRQ